MNELNGCMAETFSASQFVRGSLQSARYEYCVYQPCDAFLGQAPVASLQCPQELAMELFLFH